MKYLLFPCLNNVDKFEQNVVTTRHPHQASFIAATPRLTATRIIRSGVLRSKWVLQYHKKFQLAI